MPQNSVAVPSGAVDCVSPLHECCCDDLIRHNSQCVVRETLIKRGGIIGSGDDMRSRGMISLVKSPWFDVWSDGFHHHILSHIPSPIDNLTVVKGKAKGWYTLILIPEADHKRRKNNALLALPPRVGTCHGTRASVSDGSDHHTSQETQTSHFLPQFEPIKSK
ncbi:hypothetical protein J6590_076969 [Homalodisca vitripennis]|nr:hypothetical protein J6590_076969 [Homalodisca vitripennis]